MFIDTARHRAWFRYALAVLAVAAAAAIRLSFLASLGNRATFLTFFPAIMFAALAGGLPVGLFATGLSILTINFVWTPFVGPSAVLDSAERLAGLVFVLSGAMISAVADAMLRARARASQAESQVKLARAVCADLAIACTIQAWPWEQAGKALEDGQGDALIAGVAMTPENGALYDFTNNYLMLPGRFVMLKEPAATFDPAQLAGKAVATRRGSAHATFVRRYLPDGTLDLIVRLPFSNPTKLAFGGPELDVLYITTTQMTVGPPLPGHDKNGGVFACRVGFRGAPEVPFRG